MPKFTKLLPLFLLTGVLLLAGFGCKGLSKEQVAATQPATLEYWTVTDDVDQMQALIDQYRVYRPYLTINLKQLRAVEVYPRLVEALAEDKGPDIVSVNNRYMRAFLSKLAPMPLSAKDTTVIVQKTNLGTKTVVNTGGVSLPTALQVDKEYVQAVKNDAVVGGQVYGLPMSLDTMALYYNKDLLDKSGIAEPPKTWKEFQEQVKKLTRFDRQANKILQSGAALGSGANTEGFEDLLYILFKQSGQDFVDKSGLAIFSSARVADEQGTTAMKVMDFYTDFANPARDVYSWNKDMGSALTAFTSGQAAFFFGYSYHYDIIKARAPQLNIEILPMLQLDPEQPVNAANYWLQTVVEKSKHQNEAWALVNYLTHSAATKTYLDNTKRPSALRAYVLSQSQDPKLAPFAAQTLVADNWYKGRDYDTARAALNDMVDLWIKEPPKDVPVSEYKQGLLNTGASKVNQTL